MFLQEPAQAHRLAPGEGRKDDPVLGVGIGALARPDCGAPLEVMGDVVAGHLGLGGNDKEVLPAVEGLNHAVDKDRLEHQAQHGEQARLNVEDQENNPDSVLNYYRKLVALRKSDEFKNVFTYGEFIPEYEEMDDILAFYRTDAATSILVVANFGTDAASIELKGNVKRVLMSNQKNETVDYTKNRLNLKSCEVVVLEMKME